jgi:hypothetical protein
MVTSKVAMRYFKYLRQLDLSDFNIAVVQIDENVFWNKVNIGTFPELFLWKYSATELCTFDF